MNSKLITLIGSPASGKSTLATGVHTELKKLGKNSIFIQEAATDFIAEYGIPNTPIDQLVIFYKQSLKIHSLTKMSPQLITFKKKY